MESKIKQLGLEERESGRMALPNNCRGNSKKTKHTMDWTPENAVFVSVGAEQSQW